MAKTNRFKTKNMEFHKRGDKIQVKLLDNSWTVYRSWEIGVSDHKELRKMIQELKDYNIDFERIINTKLEDWFA